MKKARKSRKPRSTENSGNNSGKRGRVENLKSWQPGQSGNPGGRPKADHAAELARAVFEQNSDAIYRAMLKAIRRGNPKVFTALADRGYGKVPQHLALEGSEGSALTVNVRVNFVGRKKAKPQESQTAQTS